MIVNSVVILEQYLIKILRSYKKEKVITFNPNIPTCNPILIKTPKETAYKARYPIGTGLPKIILISHNNTY